MNQNKISKRQLKRMILIEGFGAFGLTIPAAAAWNSDSEGLMPMLCYGIFLFLFTAYFLSVSEKCGELPAFALNKWAGGLYWIRLFIHGIFLFYFFGLLIQTVYMPDSGMLVVLQQNNPAKTGSFSGIQVSVGFCVVFASGVLFCFKPVGRNGSNSLEGRFLPDAGKWLFVTPLYYPSGVYIFSAAIRN